MSTCLKALDRSAVHAYACVRSLDSMFGYAVTPPSRRVAGSCLSQGRAPMRNSQFSEETGSRLSDDGVVYRQPRMGGVCVRVCGCVCVCVDVCVCRGSP